MIIDNIKRLVIGIMIVLMLLSICVGVDYAVNETTVTNKEKTTNITLTNTTKINGTHYILENDSGIAKIQNDGKVIVTKPKYPIISMWAKPSVRSGYAYQWYHKVFVDYCPHCHHYKVLLKNPKGVPEREYTCKRCGADYCAVTGKEKYSWSHYYLKKA